MIEDRKGKTEALNDQFKSVFTEEDLENFTDLKDIRIRNIE